jgi:hypothetical protein
LGWSLLAVGLRALKSEKYNLVQESEVCMTKSFLFIFAVALFVTAGLASAQIEYFSGTPSMDDSLTFNQFDESLGTLTSIQIILSLQISGGQLTLDNDSEESASGTFEFGASGSITSGDVGLVNSSFVAIPGTVSTYNSEAFSLSGNVGDGEGDYDPTAPDGLQYDGGIKTNSKSDFVGSVAWGGYIGTGTYDIDYSVTQWLNYGGIGGIEYAVTPLSASGSVEVIYTYDPIPEPATITLLTIGALALLKRKNSK